MHYNTFNYYFAKCLLPEDGWRLQLWWVSSVLLALAASEADSCQYVQKQHWALQKDTA